MAEIFKANGYETAAFQGNGNAGAHYGFAQGFSTWRGSDLIDKSTKLPYPPAETIYSAFSQWFKKLRYRTDKTAKSRKQEKPFFVWINIVDPHTPYAPPPRFSRGIVDTAYKGQVKRPFANVNMGRTGELTSKDKAYIKQLYDAEVLHADHYVGRI